MFLVVILVLFIISILLALWSLKKELSRPREIDLTKKELMKEKVLFIKD